MPNQPEPSRSLLRLIIEDLERWEGKFLHLYLDDKGLPTIGIGNLVRSPRSALELPFVVPAENRPATDDEKFAAWRAVMTMRPAMRAPAYEGASPLRLTEEAVDQLVARRLDEEFLPGVRALFPAFESFPVQAKRALVDMAFNCGLAGLAGFVHLREAVGRQDWVACSSRCHRASKREGRNEWTAAMFMYAASQPEFLESQA
jgi:GH24 family phage-related lysozyme (muramidase)